MSDNKFWVFVWALVVVAIVSVSGIIGAYHYYVTKLYVDGGYEETMLVGSSYTKWQKVR